MLVVWRRLDDVPRDLSSARAYVFGVARHALQSTRRREDRQGAIAVRLSEAVPSAAELGGSSDLVTHRLDIAAAWPRLSPVHQEAIALAVLDGLTAPEAASVLGISPVAFRLRLSRARRSLREHTATTTSDGPSTAGLTSVRSAR